VVADHAGPLAGTPRPRSAETGGTTLPDDLIDALSRGFRRLRHGMVKPPLATIPIPSLGRPIDIAKVFACDAVAELTESGGAGGAGGAVTVKDVAAALELEHSTVSRLLSEAEADGLLVRGEDPADRRRTTVSLTVLGEQVVADSAAMRRFLTRSLLAGWDRAEVETLARLVTRLADTMGRRLDGLTDDAVQEFGIELVTDMRAAEPGY
jgi:DNA-binding MarR family transcriptional regulator